MLQLICDLLRSAPRIWNGVIHYGLIQDETCYKSDVCITTLPVFELLTIYLTHSYFLSPLSRNQLARFQYAIKKHLLNLSRESLLATSARFQVREMTSTVVNCFATQLRAMSTLVYSSIKKMVAVVYLIMDHYQFSHPMMIRPACSQ